MSLRAAALWWSIACACCAGCKPKASSAECDALVERYASLVVKERFPDASTAQVKSEQEREKREAQAEDGLKNCSSDVSRSELECAMHAATTDVLEKCLE
ncbi:MAG: hypothetical protein M3O50_08335 [Myxococcota bacterium]|nr:hypothetical protein [Myxococcota bacterium]